MRKNPADVSNAPAADRARGDVGSTVVVGMLAGIAATAAMTACMRRLHAALPERERYPLPPREIVETAIGPAPEHRLRDRALLLHFGFGGLVGALYGLISDRRPVPGWMFGVIVWAGSYLGWLPGFGVLKPALEHPLRRNIVMIAAHLIWGATTEILRRELHLARDASFRGGANRDAAGVPNGWAKVSSGSRGRVRIRQGDRPG